MEGDERRKWKSSRTRRTLDDDCPNGCPVLVSGRFKSFTFVMTRDEEIMTTSDRKDKQHVGSRPSWSNINEMLTPRASLSEHEHLYDANCVTLLAHVLQRDFLRVTWKIDVLSCKTRWEIFVTYQNCHYSIREYKKLRTETTHSIR